MSQRYLIQADPYDMPGKVICSFVRFETRIYSVARFDRMTFQLLDPLLPEARILAAILRNGGAGQLP